MKKLIALILIVSSIFVITGCTKNQRAKVYGGSMIINIEPNQKFVNATWKETNLWVITRSMRKDEMPEKYFMTEKSSFGIIEGEIIFEESRK